MLNLKIKLFLSKFLRYFTFGVALLILTFASQKGVFGNSWERGPQTVSAQSAYDCNWYPADPENGFPEGYYQLVGSNAADPSAWSSCIPGFSSGAGNTGSADNWVQLNPECNWDTHQVHEVWYNNATGEYWTGNEQYQIGACGYTGDSTTGNTADGWQYLYPECNWATQQVYEVWYNNITGEYWTGNEQYQPGSCGYQEASQPTQYSYARFVCDGQHAECGGHGPSPISEEWGSYMSVDNPYPGCNKTVQVDVFTKYCRDGSGMWICTENDLVNFQVWYSGVCEVPVQPVYYSEPVPQTPICQDNSQYCNYSTGTYFQNYSSWNGYQCSTQSFNTGITCVSFALPPQQPVYYPPQQPVYFPPQPPNVVTFIPPQLPVFPIVTVYPTPQPQPIPQPPSCNINSQFCNQSTGTYFQNYGVLNGNQCLTQSFNTGITCVVPQQPAPQQPIVQQQPVIINVPSQLPVSVAQSPINIANNNTNTNNNTYTDNTTNSNTNNNYSNSYSTSNAYQTQEQTVNIPPAQVITVGVQQPVVQPAIQPISQVAGLSYVKQLPSTGLPLVAWAAASFIPVGFKFRKFAKAKLEDGITANYIWEEKQFKLGD